jgi:hypothetical protein
MGLPLEQALNLIHCTEKIKKENVLCLGMQNIGFTVNDLLKSKTKFNHKVNLNNFYNLNKKQKLDQFSFFKAIGFKNVDTLDLSDYEGANIIFDLNEDKIPSGLINKYDLIYDGGYIRTYI